MKVGAEDVGSQHTIEQSNDLLVLTHCVSMSLDVRSTEQGRQSSRRSSVGNAHPGGVRVPRRRGPRRRRRQVRRRRLLWPRLPQDRLTLSPRPRNVRAYS